MQQNFLDGIRDIIKILTRIIETRKINVFMYISKFN